MKIQGSKLDIFRGGPLGPRSSKRGGPSQNPGAQTCIFMCRRFEKIRGPSGPRPQKPGSHLENPGANGPWAPVSFEPFENYVLV